MVTIQKFNGIHSLSYFKNINNKRILLFGEFHDKPGDCIPCYQKNKCSNVDNFVKKITQDTDICLDFFLESAYYNKENFHKLYLLDKTSSHQNQTISISTLKWKREKLYHQLRIHHFDIREYTKKYIIFRIFYFPEKYFNFEKDKQAVEKYQKAVQILKTATNYNYKKLYLTWFDFFINPNVNYIYSELNNNLIYQLYSNCGYIFTETDLERINYLKTKISKRYSHTLFYKEGSYKSINKFYNYFMKIHINSRKSRCPMFNQFLQEWQSKSLSNAFRIREGFKTLINLYIDIYLILRLFKTFSTSPDKITRAERIGCNLPEYLDSKNVIVYAGSRHTFFYNDFITNYFNIDPDISKISPDECVILDTPTTFF